MWELKIINNRIQFYHTGKNFIDFQVSVHNSRVLLYDVGRFHKSLNNNISDKIKKDRDILNKLGRILDMQQSLNLSKLSVSINNMLIHPIFFTINDNKLLYIVKTSKDSQYNYYCPEENILKEGSVIKINEDKNWYLSDVKYFSSKFLLLNDKKSLFLDNLKNNKIFQSIKDNLQLMSCYDFKEIHKLDIEKFKLLDLNSGFPKFPEL
jgi:hypothetical protein